MGRRGRTDLTPWAVTCVLDGGRGGYKLWESRGSEELARRAADKLAERVRRGDSPAPLSKPISEIRVSDRSRTFGSSYHYDHPTYTVTI